MSKPLTAQETARALRALAEILDPLPKHSATTAELLRRARGEAPTAEELDSWPVLPNEPTE